MKTRFYNILVPKFLRNFDDYLLRNYPVVWRTKAIWVLFYGVVGALVLFAAGFFYPVDAQHLTVPPDEPIVLYYDSYYLYCVVLISLVCLYWVFWQNQLDFLFTRIKDTILTLAIYALCFFELFAFTTSAFRLGNFYKTAYHWINNRDLRQFEQSGIYPYGCVFLDEDNDNYSDFTKKIFNDTFFQKRETIFKSIYKVEDSILMYRYFDDKKFLKKYNNDIPTDENFLKYYRLNRATISSLATSSHSLILAWSYGSYRSFMSPLLGVSFQSSYNTYKSKSIQSFDLGLNPYKFLNAQDSISTKSINRNHYTINENPFLYRPTLPYSVENAVRSVKHARQYLEERIYSRHLFLVLSYVLILSLLLYFVPFLSIRHVFGLLAACLLASAIISSKLPEHVSSVEIGQNISNGAYLLLPMLSCLLLLWASFRKKQTQGLVFAEQGLFLGLFCILIGALFVIFREKAEFDSIESYQPPYDLAFYGVQVLGILGAVLTTYVRTLPKQ